MLVTSIFSFPHYVFKRLYKLELCGKKLNILREQDYLRKKLRYACYIRVVLRIILILLTALKFYLSYLAGLGLRIYLLFIMSPKDLGRT